MKKKPHSAAVQHGPGPEPMAIGKFDGAATLSGDNGALFATPMYWLYEMGQATLDPRSQRCDFAGPPVRLLGHHPGAEAKRRHFFTIGEAHSSRHCRSFLRFHETGRIFTN